MYYDDYHYGYGRRGAGGGPAPAGLFANDAQPFWLQRENALQAAGVLYVGTCSGTTSKSNIEVHEYAGGIRKTHWLGNRPTAIDDHNAPSLSVLPDGRLMVCIAVHTQAAGTYYAISKNPLPNHGGFGRTFLIPRDVIGSNIGCSYHTAIHLENGQTVVFRRENTDSIGRQQGFARINTSDLETVDNPVWTVQRLFKRDNQRPYGLFIKWPGVANRVFSVGSNGHPDEVSTAVSLHGFTMDFTAGAPTLATMNGTPILSALPFNITEATLIKDQTGPSNGMMWPHDLVIGPDGQPWILFSRHPTVVTGADGRSINAEYWFARWDVGTSAFICHQLSSNNRTPILAQQRYVPGLCFNKSDPRKIALIENGGDFSPEIKEYSFDEITGVKTLIRTIGPQGNGLEKTRIISPAGASPATPYLWAVFGVYEDITDFEADQWADGLTATPDEFSGPLDATTVALIARMSVAPDATWQSHYDWLVRRLKVGGINGTDNWTGGAFYNFIAHDAQAARLDWKGASEASVVAGTTGPIFTAGVGYAGINTTTDYLQLLAPSGVSGFTQNGAHAGAVHNLGTGASALKRIAGGSPVLIDNLTLRINETGGLTPRNLATNTTSTNGRVFLLNNRSGAAAAQYYMDGALMKTRTEASVAVDTAALLVGYSNTLPTETVTLGGSKTAAQVADLAYALAGFRRRVQAPAAP
jgi:hypothetical protein